MLSRSLIRFIWQFVRPQRWIFFFCLFVSFAWSLDATLWPYFLKRVIDILTQFDAHRAEAWFSLKWPLLLGLCFWLTTEMSYRCQGFLQAKMFPKLEADMRLGMFDHIQKHSPKYFNEQFAGSLANKITDMINQVTTLLQLVITMFVPAIAACVMAVIFFARINPYFAAVLATWILIHAMICVLFARKCDTYENIHGEVRSTLIGKIVDSFTNNFAVNLFYRFAHEKTFISVFQKKERESQYQAKRYVEWMRFILGLFTFLGAGLAVNGLMFYFWLKGKITTGDVAQLFNTSWNIVMILWLTGSEIPRLFQAIGIAKQALTVMQAAQDVVDDPEAKPLTISSGEIVFDNVTFHYPEKELFHNKYAYIQGGEKIGLVGYSGGGKSTFVSLILRLHPLEAGNIYIDGQDVSKVTLESLRRQVALIPQDPILFHRSLKENIRYGRLEATDEEVFQAAKLAHCDEFIRKIPTGYETQVGERGARLSGGERQRIAIARAILTNAPILILDEATSALDSMTEAYIQDSLEKLMRDRTSIVIAHRLSTLAKMDRVFVFDQGKIVEEGTHSELLASSSHYAKMWSKQAGSFRKI